jgi:WD40 repeat protein
MSRPVLGLLLLVAAWSASASAEAQQAERLDLEALWTDLAGADATVGYQAIWAFAAVPEQSVPFLKERLRPVPPPDRREVEQLLDDLQSPQFAVRDKATRELEKLAELAQPFLEAALKRDSSLEFRRRVEQLLSRLERAVMSPERLRQIRAAEALEYIGTDQARQLLGRLAQGFAGARLTSEAREALERLGKRPAGRGNDRIAGPRPSLDLYGDPLPAGAVARLGTLRFRHPPDDIRQIAIGPDGKAIITLGARNISFLSLADGKLLRQIRADAERPFTASALTPDGKQLVTAGRVGDVQDPTRAAFQFWDLASGKEVRTLLLPAKAATPTRIVFAQDGKTIVGASSDGLLRVWEVTSGREVHHFNPIGKLATLALAFSPDSNLVAAGGRGEDNLYLWESRTGRPARKFGTKLPPVLALAFSPDGKTLAVGSDDQIGLRLWDVANGRLLRSLPVEDGSNRVTGVAFSRDGQFLAASFVYHAARAYGLGVAVWETATGKLLHKWETKTPDGYPREVAFTPDGRLVAARTTTGIRVWDRETGEPVSELPGHRSAVSHLALSPQADTIATAGDDGTIRLWDLGTGAQRFVVRHDHWVRAIALSPDGKRLASSSFDDTVRLWDVNTGREVYKLAGHGQRGNGRLLAFTADSRRLASWGDDMYLRVWDVAKGKALAEHWAAPEHIKPPKEEEGQDESNRRGHLAEMLRRVGDFALSPDGKLFVLAWPISPAKAVQLFDVLTGKEIISIPGTGERIRLAFSADGKLLLAGDWSTRTFLGFWKLPSGKLVRQVPSAGEAFSIVAFSADGRSFATAIEGSKSKIYIWELAGGGKRRTIDGLDRPVRSLVFSPDGRRLISGMDDTTALVWDLSWPRKESEVRSPKSQ